MVSLAQSAINNRAPLEDTDELSSLKSSSVSQSSSMVSYPASLTSPRSRAPLVLSVPETRVESINLDEEYYEPDPYYTYEDLRNRTVPEETSNNSNPLFQPNAQVEAMYSNSKTFRKNALKKLTHKGKIINRNANNQPKSIN